MQKIKKDDEVIVITGKDKGKIGRVTKVLGNKVLVEGINLSKKSQKPNPNAGISGGFISKEMPIDISNIGIYNPQIKKVDKVGFKFLEDGKKIRYFKSTNENIDG